MSGQVHEDTTAMQAPGLAAASMQPAGRALPPWVHLLALMVIVPAPSLGAAMEFWWARDSALGSIAYMAGKAVLYGLPLVWVFLIERSRPSWSKPQRGGLGFGAVLGLLISGLIFAVFFLFAEPRIDTTAIRDLADTVGFGEPLPFLGVAAYICTVNALLEEYVFRWFIFRRFEALLPSAVAVIAAALAFTAHHVVVLRAYFAWDLTLLASAGVFLGGLIWTWCYLRYRSIWPGFISHALVDIAIFVIGWRLIFG